MAFVDSTLQYSIAFTKNARKKFLQRGSDKNKIAYFSFADTDVNYANAQVTAVTTSDFTGDNEDCVLSLSSCFDYNPSIKTIAQEQEEEAAPINIYPLSDGGTFENTQDSAEYTWYVPAEDNTNQPIFAILSNLLISQTETYNNSTNSLVFISKNGWGVSDVPFLRSQNTITLNANSTYELTTQIYVPNGYEPNGGDIDISLLDSTQNEFVDATYTYTSKFNLSNDDRGQWKLLKTVIETTNSVDGYYTVMWPSIITPNNQALAYIDNINLYQTSITQEDSLVDPVTPYVDCNDCGGQIRANEINLYVDFNKINSNNSIGPNAGHLLRILPSGETPSGYYQELVPATSTTFTDISSYLDWYVAYFEGLDFLNDSFLNLGTTNETIWTNYPYSFFKIRKVDDNTLKYTIDLNYWYMQFLMQDNAYVTSDRSYYNFVIDPNNLREIDFSLLYEGGYSNLVADIVRIEGLECIDFSTLDDKFVKDCFYPLYYDLYLRQMFDSRGLSLIGRDICDKDSYSTCN